MHEKVTSLMEEKKRGKNEKEHDSENGLSFSCLITAIQSYLTRRT